MMALLLSRDREEQLMIENMPKIYRAVDNFSSRPRSSCVVLSYDDLVQQVAEAFLRYIRRCETEEQLAVFPWYDATHAMSELVLASQALSVPHSTKTFSQVIHSMPGTVSYDVLATKGIDVDGMSKHWVPDKDTEMDFNLFMDSQDELTQRVASMRIAGLSIRQIAAQCGVSKSLIQKRIAQLYEKFKNFYQEEDDDE